MKLRTKDEIITCLIDMLSQDISKTTSSEDYIHQGWIEALKWVLGIYLIENTISIKDVNKEIAKELSKGEQKDVDSNS